MIHPLVAELAAAREGRGLSVADAARGAGLNRTTVRAWECGLQAPRLVEVSAYAASLGYAVTVEPAPGEPTIGELMTRLISTLHDLYRTPPDRQGAR